MDITTLILKNSYTKPEALRKLRSLSASVEASLYGGDYRLDPSEELYAAWLRDATAQVLSEKPNKEGPSLQTKNIFSLPEKTLRAIEPVVLYLPFELPEEGIKKIVGKLREGDNKSCLIEIKYDPSLLAGCAISYKGNYKDYSLRAKLAEKRRELEIIVEKL